MRREHKLAIRSDALVEDARRDERGRRMDKEQKRCTAAADKDRRAANVVGTVFVFVESKHTFVKGGDPSTTTRQILPTNPL